MAEPAIENGDHRRGPLLGVFSKARRGGLPAPIKVGYTTWKSEVGVRAEERLAGDPRFEFRSIRETADWAAIAELYRWSDVFLGCPGPEEGFYLVGLEALAAGCLLVMADALGNRSYARWGHNCTEVPLEDDQAYARAVTDIAGWTADQVETRRNNGYADLADFTLDRERREFGRFLAGLDTVEPEVDRVGATATASS